MRKSLIILILLLVSACAVHEDTYYRNINANNLIAESDIDENEFIKKLGVIINFEDLKGYIRHPAKENTYSYSKSIDKYQNHSAAIIIYQVFPPYKITNESEFFQELLNDLTKLRDKNDIEFTVKLDKSKAPWCVLFHRVSTINKKGGYIYDAYEYICKHPYRDNLYVNIGYSESYKDKGIIKNINRRVSDIFDRITLVE